MTFRLTIPDAPKDLWRKMLAVLTEDESKLNMESWHSFETKSEGLTFFEFADNKKEVKCSTVHCMAGWAIVLTPDGIEFEDKIRKKLEKDYSFIDDLSDYARKGDDNEASLAALLILEKAGWSEYVRMKDFTTLEEADALKLIKKLARMEKRREDKERGVTP